MDFSEFRHTIEHYLVKANPNFDLSSLDLNNVFEAYVSDVTPREYIASMKKSINESVAVSDQYEKYYNRTVSLIKKSGYTIQSMPRELDEDISDFYDNGYTTAECANYLLEKIEKNTVKLKEPTTIRNVELKNKLLRLMHDVENAGLVGIDTHYNDIYAVIKIKLFDVRNEISTDIKSYINELHRYFKPYVNQNVDNNARLEIIGYSINQRSVYCTVKLKVDIIETEDGKPVFSANETKNIIEFYIKIFRMFAEQYSNMI
jgi:hypothetical protein